MADFFLKDTKITDIQRPTMTTNEQDIIRLRQAVEQTAGRPMLTPKDFDFLSANISERLKETVSVSTLKRLWGYTSSYATTRTATLDILSRYVGHDSWEEFVAKSQAPATAPTAPTPTTPTTPQPTAPTTPTRRHTSWLYAAPLVVLLLAALYFVLRPADDDEKHYLIRSGQHFAQPDDYLHLFGIMAPNADFYDQPLPHHQGIIVWSPQYQHPRWHNEGSIDDLLPTITEYWTPDTLTDDSAQAEITRQKNANLYFTVRRTNELRITFMRGVNKPDDYTFLGIYRADLDRSDSTRIVWQRIADECDLRNLDYLEQLRN